MKLNPKIRSIIKVLDLSDHKLHDALFTLVLYLYLYLSFKIPKSGFYEFCRPLSLKRTDVSK